MAATNTITMRQALTTSTTSSSSGPAKPAIVGTETDPATLPIRRLSKADVPRAANCLASAFAQDSVARYFTHTSDGRPRTEAQRWALHLSVMKYVLHAHLLRGLVLGIGSPRPSTGRCSSKKSLFLPTDPLNPTSEESLDAIALFMPPGANMDDLCTILRSGLWRLHLQLSREGRRRFFGEFMPLLHETKLSVFGTPEADAQSWYLVYLGTRTGARGKGLAGRLVRSVTEKQCDAEGRDCYLESSSKVNLKLYRRLGFEVVRTIELSRDKVGGKVEMDIMVRKPKEKKDGGEALLAQEHECTEPKRDR